MAELDTYPAAITGPHRTNTSRHVRYARMFTYGGRLYIAESRTRGQTVTDVTGYPLPEGELVINRNNTSSWGDWWWTSCGCGNSWNRHTKESLVALAVEVEHAESVPDGTA